MELVAGSSGPVGAAIGAAIGAARGAATYIGSAAIGSGEESLTGLAGSTVTGAAVSGLTAPAGISAMQAGALTIVGTQVGFYRGMAGGFAQSASDQAGTDHGGGAGCMPHGHAG